MGLIIKGNIVITENNGISHTIEAEDMDFEIDNVEDAPMGPKKTHRGTWENGSVEVNADVEEYPIGTNNGINIDVDGGVLISNNLETEVTE